MRKQYWAVRWGDQKIDTGDVDGRGDKVFDHNPTAPNMREDVLRIASIKTEDPKEACRNCWGVVKENMWVKSLGSDVSVLRSTRKRIRALNDPSGWTRIGSARSGTL